jgi:ABC-2 type transport system ATP-binding protein
VIEVDRVTKAFYTVVAVNDLSLDVPEGEVIGVLGPNGAGKTTLFKLLAGFLKPDKGRIRAKRLQWPSIGYKPERLLFPNQMRVSAYLEMVAALSNINGREIRRVVYDSLSRVNLLDASQKRIGDCSKGMRQRLGLAQALIGDPPLLILDEPSNGLDPDGQATIASHIQQLRQMGKTILLSSHQLHEVTQVCTHLVIMNQGQILYERSMAEALIEQPHALIRVNQSLAPVAALLQSLHPEVVVHEQEIVLNNEAMGLRRQVLSILLAAGYDILKVEQQRVTLAEIYAEATR